MPCARQSSIAVSLTAPLPPARYIQTRGTPAATQSATAASVSFADVINNAPVTGGYLVAGPGAESRDEVLAHCRALAAATELPISADLENGFGDDPKTVAETIQRAAEVGLVGGSVVERTALDVRV